VLKQSSDGLGWKRVFASQQVAQPFHERIHVRPVNDPLNVADIFAIVGDFARSRDMC
jgi:hypothetical protein